MLRFQGVVSNISVQHGHETMAQADREEDAFALQRAIPAAQELQIGEHRRQSTIEEAASSFEVEEDRGAIERYPELSQTLRHQRWTAAHPGADHALGNAKENEVLEVFRQDFEQELSGLIG